MPLLNILLNDQSNSTRTQGPWVFKTGGDITGCGYVAGNEGEIPDPDEVNWDSLDREAKNRIGKILPWSISHDYTKKIFIQVEETEVCNLDWLKIY
jgi:hypothetical protein